METRNLDKSHLADLLFPKHRHPGIAFSRLINGRSKLDEKQIFRLAMFCNLSIDQLYEESMNWKMTSREGLVRFTLDNFSAIYSPVTGITKIYHLESLLATHVLSKPNQPLSEYLAEINNLVINKSIKS
jgi:hypothetical protein